MLEEQILGSSWMWESKCEGRCWKIKNCHGKLAEGSWQEEKSWKLEAKHPEEGITMEKGILMSSWRDEEKLLLDVG